MKPQRSITILFIFAILGWIVAGCSKNTPPQAISTASNAETSQQTEVNAHATAASKMTVRFATYNVSLYRKASGQLVSDLATGQNQQAHKLSTVIQHVRPDVLLLNEFDYDSEGAAADSFCELYLGVEHDGVAAIDYPFRYFAESNTGMPSGLDLDADGKTDGLADCFGFGKYPGQYGMLVLSRFPIQVDEVRTFQKFLWKDMPGAMLPTEPQSNEPYYSDENLAAFDFRPKATGTFPSKF